MSCPALSWAAVSENAFYFTPIFQQTLPNRTQSGLVSFKSFRNPILILNIVNEQILIIFIWKDNLLARRGNKNIMYEGLGMKR
jgi:hypothetical protein